MKKAADSCDGTRTIVIPNLHLHRIVLRIRGTSPYVQNRFSAKAAAAILENQQSTKATRKKAGPLDVEEQYQNAFHRSPDGKCGIPATAFRNAMISACRVAGFQMTKGKMSVFIDADFYDEVDGVPLVAIFGDYEKLVAPVRTSDGKKFTMSVRPMWREWSAVVKINYDPGQFGPRDVAHLMIRVGIQVGVGEGRPDSKNSNGCGWGTYCLEEK